VPLRDLTGHRRVVELLSRSIAREALPPSLIFAGAEGSGKRAAAVAVAQTLNCLTPRQPADTLPTDACGRCAACTRIERGVHPDVAIVEPGDSGSIKIETVRDVIDRAGYRPFEGRWRVVIIDDADALVVAAQNALLKTLEEPSSSSVFILLTARPDMLLATVRSRCIRLRFVEAPRIEVDEGARLVAQRVLSQAAASADATRLDSAKDLLANTGSSAASDREQVNAHLKAMASLLRDIAVVSTRAESALANDDLRASIERLVPAYGGERGVRAFAAIDRAMAAIAGNAGIKVVADWLVLQL
jgi:DNA polymerase-3 subunit delta'